jgi:hypothetical protein
MQKSIGLFLILAHFCFLPSRFPPTDQAIAGFELEGIAVFQCQCTALACPCQKNGAPTHGTCESADFVHISRGLYGGVKLDGLNAVTIGNLVDKNKVRLYATIYIDAKASAEQRKALTSLLQFMNGGYETAPLQASRVVVVPITFTESSDKTAYTILIPSILEERTYLRREASGKPVSTETAMDSWANVEHYADNLEFRYHDVGLHKSWDHSGAYANVKYFHLTKEMYDRKELLGQYGDFSGRWTSEQLNLIHKQGLSEK